MLENVLGTALVVAFFVALCGGAMPVLDDRAPEDILGYDEHGLPR
jgi:hypothetical protein